MLSVDIIDDEYSRTCDWCLREFKIGDFIIGDIEICCCVQCSRRVCEACITEAYNKIQELKND